MRDADWKIPQEIKYAVAQAYPKWKAGRLIAWLDRALASGSEPAGEAERRKQFGAALRSLRVSLGVSLREAAEWLGTTHVRFGEVERGRDVLTAPASEPSERLREAFMAGHRAGVDWSKEAPATRLSRPAAATVACDAWLSPEPEEAT